jgi:hypothetical protein
MEDCKDTPLKPVFGSCRKLGRFECTEFVSEKDCKKYPALMWDKSNCYEQTPTEINYYKYSIKNLPKYYVGK